MQLALKLPWTVLGSLMRACNAIPRALLAARGVTRGFAAEDRSNTLRCSKTPRADVDGRNEAVVWEGSLGAITIS